MIDTIKQLRENYGRLDGTVLHSDRGCQYTSYAFRRELVTNGLIQSLSGTAHCYDNASMESFFATLSGIALPPVNGNGNTPASTERDRAVANNTTSAIEWYTEVFADRMLISALLILISKSLDNQSAFGRGIDTGGQTAKESYVTGALNNKGLFWGDTAAGSSAVGYNFLGDYYLTTAAFRPDSHGYPTKMSFGEYGMLPKALGGFSTTFYSVYFYTGTNCALFGDNSDAGLKAGSLSMNMVTSQNTTSTYIEGSLSCKPVANKAT